MEFVEQFATEPIGGLRGLLTVVGTLLFVGLCFVVVELIDRRSGPAAAPAGAGRAARATASSASAGVVRPLDNGTSDRSATTDLRADVPADDIWPLRGDGSRAPVGRSFPSSNRGLVCAAGGSVLAVVVALASIPIRDQVGTASIALALVLVVVAAAAAGGRVAAAVTSAAAALAFNFTHTTPIYTFHIAETSDIVTSILMIVIGISVGEVAVRTFHSGATDST